MTIVVTRRRKKRSKLEIAILSSRRVAGRRLTGIQMLLVKQLRKERRACGARIRRFAKKYGLQLRYQRKEWIFRARSGEKIAMAPGYYARVRGVLEYIIAP